MACLDRLKLPRCMSRRPSQHHAVRRQLSSLTPCAREMMDPMFVVLQLSDLHRSAADPVGNAELVAALESDRARWPPEVGHGPDIVVISGDLVQGVGLGATDSDEELEKQYADAGAFLAEVADRFLDSDRSRLVLVPGNHDVDWCTARSAMKVVDDDELERVGGDVQWSTLDPASHYRWSWGERQLYRVVDPQKYKARHHRFLEFRRTFYAEVRPNPIRLAPDLFFMEYPSLDVSVTGLSSWYGNDCYCRVGAFDPDMLAAARDAIAASPCGLHLAVWHHSTVGPPAETDYLDVRHVHRLIDYGFRIGLHGHHHRTDANVMTLKLPTSEELALVSAGSLAAGRRELPVGVHRQYSLLQIEPSECRLRVHVREAISDLIFAANSRTELGGQSYVDLTWSPTPPSRARTTAFVAAVDDAYQALAERNPGRAWEILRGLPELKGSARRLVIAVLRELENWDEIVSTIGTPATQEELMDLVGALCHLGLPRKARQSLDAYAVELNLAPDLRAQLDARISITEVKS